MKLSPSSWSVPVMEALAEMPTLAACAEGGIRLDVQRSSSLDSDTCADCTEAWYSEATLSVRVPFAEVGWGAAGPLVLLSTAALEAGPPELLGCSPLDSKAAAGAVTIGALR